MDWYSNISLQDEAGGPAPEQQPSWYERVGQSLDEQFPVLSTVNKLARSGVEQAGKQMVGDAEVGLTFGTGIAGLAEGGMASTVAATHEPTVERHGGVMNAMNATIEAVAEKRTYQPKTEAGQNRLQQIGEGMENIGETLLPVREGFEKYAKQLGIPLAVSAAVWAALAVGAETVNPAKGLSRLARMHPNVSRLAEKYAGMRGGEKIDFGPIEDALKPATDSTVVPTLNAPDGFSQDTKSLVKSIERRREVDDLQDSIDLQRDIEDRMYDLTENIGTKQAKKESAWLLKIYHDLEKVSGNQIDELHRGSPIDTDFAKAITAQDGNLGRGANALLSDQPLPEADPRLTRQSEFTPEVPPDMDAPIGGRKVEMPMSEDDFYNNFDMHTDLRGRDANNALANMESISSEGFREGFGINRMPSSASRGNPKGMAGQYNPKEGDVVYLIPSSDKTKTVSGRPRMPQGWKPGGEDGGIAVEIKPGEDLYAAYKRTSKQRGSVTVIDDDTKGVNALARAGTRATAAMDSPPPIADVTTKVTVPPLEPRIDLAPRNAKTGQYRGGPSHINTPQKRQGLRKRLMGMIEEGALGRLWYDESSASNLSLTAERPGLRNRLAADQSITSSGTEVNPNQGHAITAYNQQAAGDPVSAGLFHNKMSPKMDEVAAGVEHALQNKTGPFYEGVSQDPGDVVRRPTNDIRNGRAFEYDNDMEGDWDAGFSEAQHRYMDSEIEYLVVQANKKKLAGHDDWNVERIQAAMWISQKARQKGISIEQASYNFGSELDARTANINVESAPANSLQHMEGAYGSPEGQRALFDVQNNLSTDDAGRNILATHANALTRESREGQGYYAGELNPVATTRVLGGMERGGAGLETSSAKVVNTIGSTEGMLQGQETVGTSFLRPAKKAAERNAAIGPQRDIAEVSKVLEESFPDGYGGSTIIATPSSEGVRYLVVGDVPTNWQQQLHKIIDPDKKFSEVKWRQNSGELLGNDDFSGYKPSRYLETIDDTVAGNMDEAVRWKAKELEKIDDAFEAEMPKPGVRNPILQKTRQALAEGGIAKVRELVKQGILPAVVLGIIAGESLSGAEEGSANALYDL